MATIRWWKPALWASICSFVCGGAMAQQAHSAGSHSLQREQQRSRRFLSQRGAFTNGQSPAELLAQAHLKASAASGADSGFVAAWTSVGPAAVQTTAFGAISGRVTSIAADPSDITGNTVYVGTTGGGVWKSTNAAGPQSSVTFSELTDTLPASSNCTNTPVVSSLSIGALTVQPGGTGVILAGTGDPNDALDSYYGEGILRSTDGGQTWCLISQAADNLVRTFSFVGEGFAGFAWSTQQTVVAAVAESAEGAVVDAESQSANSFAGLYYSQDAGVTWHLATITDGPGMDIQRPDLFVSGTGNSATSVTWNPVRKRFYAAVRYHGYYESTDGTKFTRLQSQPGAGLFSAQCPANPGSTGSEQCPIFRGTVVAQPVSGDLFAITVDNNNADQGLWRDVCDANSNGCASSTVTFSQNIPDTAVEKNGQIEAGDYTLTLAAVPSQADTLLFLGGKDIFYCSLLNNCFWQNTTNVDNQACAQSGPAPYQHAINADLAQTTGLIYFGNDGGLWRTTHAETSTPPSCGSASSSYYDNLNGGLGPISEVGVFSADPQNPGVMMAALGEFGTAALAGSGTSWTIALAGEGDNNAIDPQNSQNWYATSAPAGSSPFIESCSSGSACASSGEWNAAIGSGQIGNDLTGPIVPWILDPQNTANIIIGTCRVWRGLASGQSWTQGNLLSNPLDNDQQNSDCNGNALIRSLAASGGSGNIETIYAGMAGWADGGASVAGHIYSATVPTSGGLAAWSDLTQNPIINAPGNTFNAGGFDISSIYVDPHDATGKTLYVTRQGFITPGVYGALAYRSVDAGAHWISISNNLPDAPMNSILVDPNDANTVYVATDAGVWATRNIISCTDTSNVSCWQPLGSGLPKAPVTQLRYVSSGNAQVLLASTYGRGIWQIPLLSSGVQPTTATLTPSSLTFAGQTQNTVSSSQTITVTNTGTVSLSISSIIASQGFLESDNCSQPVASGQTCNIQVEFAPQQTGTIQGTLTVFGNLAGGQITATLSGTGLAPGNLIVLPGSLNFGNAIVGTTTSAQDVTISNTGGISVNLQQPSITGDFQITANTCGTALPANTGCTVAIAFSPKAPGARSGTFSISNGQSTQTVLLAGNGQTQATAQLSATSVNFSTPVTVGAVSSPQSITLTNTGDAALAQISVTPDGDFLVQNNCPALLPGHTACALVVSFAPKQAGAETGSLNVSTALGLQTVALSGTGLAPAGISLLPTSLNFGGQGVGVTSSKHSVTLTNNGGVPLTGLSFAVTGGDFSIADSTCQSGGALAAGSACVLDLTFTPAQTQLRTGTLTVNAAQLPVSYTVPLSGTGEDFTIAIVGQTSQAIVNGQSASYQVQITSVDGSSGPVQVSCSGLPQNATCASGLAAGATLTGSASMTATVTIATGVSSSAALRWPRTVAMAFAFLPWLFVSRKQKRLLHLWTVCMVSLVLLASTACGTSASGGSGSGPGAPTGSTPSNTYTINISATLDGLTKSAAVQLTVQ